MTLLKTAFAVSALFFVFMAPSHAACCSYGCCDCGCVALKAKGKAAKLSRAIGRHGILQSYSINASDKKSGSGNFKCSMQAEVAVCKR